MKAAGPSFSEQMRDFYPVIVQPSGGDAERDIIYLDRDGDVKDRHLLEAVLSGRKILLGSQNNQGEDEDSDVIDI